jgi:hypothetical protein
MPVPSRRIAVAGVIAAAVIALPAAALASASSPSSGKPAPSATASKSVPPNKSPAAAGKSPTPDPSAAAAMKAAARQSGAGEQQAMSAMVASLATQLGVSHAAAQRAFSQIDALSNRNGVDPASPAFAAIAHQLGVTPVRLAAALDGAKQAAAHSAAGQ